MCYKVKDIANKLLVMSSEAGELMTNLKLQKMLYYQQGFHLAYFNTPLFEDEIEAWMYGPVVPSVYDNYSSYGSNGIEGDSTSVITLSESQEESLFAEVFRVYSKFSALGLMDMTHQEMPWKSTPVGKGHVIEKDKMKSFFKERLK